MIARNRARQDHKVDFRRASNHGALLVGEMAGLSSRALGARNRDAFAATRIGLEDDETIGADDSAEETLRTMAKYQVRLLPVIDGHNLVCVVAQADVARALPHDVVGAVLEEVSEK
jgi:CBS-domain-containing membrane protein